MTVDIRVNIERTRNRIIRAAERSGRPPEDVTLVAVAKTFPVHVVEEAIAAGIGDVGENRAQELRDKVAVLGDRVRWHFVGHLQTNKVRTVVGGIVLLHSVDRYGLAEAVARRARSLDIVQDVLLEVNIAGEPSKHGVEPAAAKDLASEVAALEGVRVRGLMTMPPLTEDPEDSRPYFRDLASLRDQLVGSLPEATELSMGMTRDVEQGRDKLNFSTWEGSGGDAHDAAEAIADGSMPPRRYTLIHPDAALSDAEQQVLVDALEAMGGRGGGDGGGGGDRSGPGGGGGDGGGDRSGPGG